MITKILTASTLALVASLSALPVAEDSTSGGTRGWTSVDFNYPGSSVTSPYSGAKTGTIQVELYLKKSPALNYEKLTIDVDVQKGKSMCDLAQEFYDAVRAEGYDPQENPDGYHFEIYLDSNGVTITGTDADQMPDTDNPNTQQPPDGTGNSTMNLTTNTSVSDK